jgi:hypothetical protein
MILTVKFTWMDLCPTKWHDIVDALPKLKMIAEARDKQKGGYASTRNWTVEGSTHFTGICGEYCTSLETGLSMDENLLVEGDPGHDFVYKDVSYDTKTANFWTEPHLKEFTNRSKWADVYILAALKDYRWVRLVGWVTLKQLRAARLSNYGHGDMLSVTCDDLCDLKQLGLPPGLVEAKRIS